MGDKRAEQYKCETWAELVKLGAKRGYKNPEFWATKIMEARKKRERGY